MFQTSLAACSMLNHAARAHSMPLNIVAMFSFRWKDSTQCLRPNAASNL